ncbi:hypothetical protein KKC13_13415 [bacterium]|nr:hypothetical protein [bacterium]MBU1959349.1 hypothetical protein [bacterium]
MHLLQQTLGFTLITLILTACGGGGSSPTSSTTQSEFTDTTTSNSTTTANNSTVTTNTPNTAVTTSLPDSTTTTLTPSLQKVALDNMGNNVQKPFNEYEIRVLSDKNLTESDQTSQETIAVYGTINGLSTKALLKINSHYRESNLTIEVYKNSQLLVAKKELSLTNQIAVDFGQIDIN